MIDPIFVRLYPSHDDALPFNLAAARAPHKPRSAVPPPVPPADCRTARRTASARGLRDLAPISRPVACPHRDVRIAVPQPPPTSQAADPPHASNKRLKLSGGPWGLPGLPAGLESPGIRAGVA